VVLTNQAGKDSWPMAGASFILMHAKPAKPEQSREVLKFFDFAFKNGAKSATELDYVPLPPATTNLIREEWKKVTDASGKAVM
jgi:phosphate transport system substrate-binding protein